MYNIINLKTNRYKLNTTGNIIHSILNGKLMRPFVNSKNNNFLNKLVVSTPLKTIAFNSFACSRKQGGL